jgi:hypothetical protein
MERRVVHWQVDARKLGIVITCRGHDKERQVEACVRAFEALIQQQPAAVVVIADLAEMTGYESSSRVAWQDAFREHRKRMKRLVLVGARSKIIRMGAAVVGAFAGVPVTFVDAWSDLHSLDLSA